MGRHVKQKPSLLSAGIARATAAVVWLATVISLFLSAYWPYAIPIIIISIGLGFLPWANHRVASLQGAIVAPYAPVYGGQLSPGANSSSVVPTNAGTVILGNNRVLSADLSNVVIEYNGSPLITMGLDAQGVWIDTTVVDAQGNYIGIIHKREFKASEERAFNPIQSDPQSILIRDLAGKPVLDLHYDNSRQLVLKGYFRYGSGHQSGLIVMDDNGLRIGGMITISNSTFSLGSGGKGISIGAGGIGIGGR